jgi:O-antigen ligase
MLIIHRKLLFFLSIFLLSLLATGYFGLPLRRNQPPAPANTLAATNDYGVTVDLTQYTPNQLTNTLTNLQQTGLTWLRVPIRWADIEPKRGQFDWHALDAALAQTDDFRLIAMLHTAPAWAVSADAPPTTPPTELSDFGAFARAIAARYGHQIDYYQIWHEPNLSINWGNAFVDPAAYANLLREATLNIRATDATAYILTAALAPTLENGPLNLNEPAYLDQLYQAQAHRYFDIAAVQPYGFEADPAAPPQPDALNFRRTELLRDVMLRHGDAATPLWATAFGWNSLPANWAGQPSPWKSDSPQIQGDRTAAAITLARRDWPWLGPMLAIRWDGASLSVDDPARGFALTEIPPVLAALKNAATAGAVAAPGQYPAGHPTARYSEGWRLAQSQADAPRHAPRTLTIPFEGTRLNLQVNRGPFRGYLWVTVDGQPANALPQDGQGHSYVVLYDPLRGQESVTLAQYLPPGRHEAVIEADGGWGQWAISGWTVANETDTRRWRTGTVLAALLALLSGAGLIWQIKRAPVLPLIQDWGRWTAARYNHWGESTHIILTFAVAVWLYLLPGLMATVLLPLLALLIFLRPDLGLALIAFSLSFFQRPVQLIAGSFSPVELTLALTALGFLIQFLIHSINLKIQNLSGLDWAAIFLTGLALAATFAAENFGVSMREWRVVVFESVLFYFLVRQGIDFGPKPPADNRRWAWRLVDAFVAGAALQAAIALYLYFFTDRSITAEGVYRALGLAYGSPNNLSLFLDRAWPILLAVTVLPGNKLRRGLYSGGLAAVSMALYFTFSKGTLLIGLPAGVAAMALFYLLVHRPRHWRRVVMAATAGVGVIILTVIPLSQTARFRTTFDMNPGSTGFFRLKLWQASLSMLKEHWPLGVGLDNFLYQYRTRYILPEAWQEPNLSHPHNFLLDFGTRLGMGGIAVLVWLQTVFWLAAWRLYKTWPSPLILGLMGSMIIFLAHGLVDNSYFLVDLAFAFFLTVGLVQGLTNSEI